MLDVVVRPGRFFVLLLNTTTKDEARRRLQGFGFRSVGGLRP